MAILKNGLQFSGSVGNMSAYQMKGTDKTVIRTKGGPTREQIQHEPQFEPVRNNNDDFGTCSWKVKLVRKAIEPVRHLSDYNFTPALVSRARQAQRLDTDNEPGSKEVLFEAHPYLLEGFALHKRFPFDHIISSPVTCQIDRRKHTATVTLPQLIPGANLQLPWQQPLFRVVASLGLIWVNEKTNLGHSVMTATPWQPALEPLAATTLKLQLPGGVKQMAEMGVIVCVGVETGRAVAGGEIRALEYGGSAKILALG